MEHDTQIAIRFDDNPNQYGGSVPLSHDYRRRWWLPVIGPTATCLLEHISHNRHDDWRTLYIDELASSLGIGYKKSHRQLFATLDRLVHFGFAEYTVPPNDPHSPTCITFYKTTRPVPSRYSSQWPTLLQTNHDHARTSLVTT